VSKVIWLPKALDDADRLFAFLKEKKPKTANKVAKTLVDGAKLLSDFPEIGRPLNDDTQRRELFLPFGRYGYILRYVIKNKDVLIVRAWHSKENPD
jgi:plasmid stabilization system protein ParE